jgi:hypothetical protein
LKILGALGRPPPDEIVGLLARCAVVVFGAHPHGHVAFVGANDEALAELAKSRNVQIFLLKGLLNLLFELELVKKQYS